MILIEMNKQFEKKLNNIKTTFSLASQEYVSSYPNAKIFAGSQAYQRPFNTDRQTLSDANGDLFELDAQVNTRINKQLVDIEKLDRRIAELKEINKKLTAELANIRSSDRAAIGRYENSQERSFLGLYYGLTLGAVAIVTYNHMSL
jgi:cell shape-determining protein MreC